jgi:hypothetical protein
MFPAAVFDVNAHHFLDMNLSVDAYLIQVVFQVLLHLNAVVTQLCIGTASNKSAPKPLLLAKSAVLLHEQYLLSIRA